MGPSIGYDGVLMAWARRICDKSMSQAGPSNCHICAPAEPCRYRPMKCDAKSILGRQHMNRLRSLTAAVAMVALAAGVVYAQGPRPGGPGGRGRLGPLGGLPLRELQLTDAQQQQVKDIRSRHEADIRDAMTRLQKARQTQQAAVEAVP